MGLPMFLRRLQDSKGFSHILTHFCVGHVRYRYGCVICLDWMIYFTPAFSGCLYFAGYILPVEANQQWQYYYKND